VGPGRRGWGEQGGVIAASRSGGVGDNRPVGPSLARLAGLVLVCPPPQGMLRRLSSMVTRERSRRMVRSLAGSARLRSYLRTLTRSRGRGGCGARCRTAAVSRSPPPSASTLWSPAAPGCSSNTADPGSAAGVAAQLVVSAAARISGCTASTTSGSNAHDEHLHQLSEAVRTRNPTRTSRQPVDQPLAAQTLRPLAARSKRDGIIYSGARCERLCCGGRHLGSR